MDTTCAVCLEQTDQFVYDFDCSHGLCCACNTKWKQHGNNCTICRASLKTNVPVCVKPSILHACEELMRVGVAEAVRYIITKPGFLPGQLGGTLDDISQAAHDICCNIEAMRGYLFTSYIDRINERVQVANRIRTQLLVVCPPPPPPEEITYFTVSYTRPTADVPLPAPTQRATRLRAAVVNHSENTGCQDRIKCRSAVKSHNNDRPRGSKQQYR